MLTTAIIIAIITLISRVEIAPRGYGYEPQRMPKNQTIRWPRLLFVLPHFVQSAFQSSSQSAILSVIQPGSLSARQSVRQAVAQSLGESFSRSAIQSGSQCVSQPVRHRPPCPLPRLLGGRELVCQHLYRKTFTAQNYMGSSMKSGARRSVVLSAMMLGIQSLQC